MRKQMAPIKKEMKNVWKNRFMPKKKTHLWKKCKLYQYFSSLGKIIYFIEFVNKHYELQYFLYEQ